jgi:hypothetical protein
MPNPVGVGTTRGPSKISTSDWRVQLLTDIGAPTSATNLAALQAWALSESGYNSTYGTNLASPAYGYNPLAISDGYGVPTVGMVNSIVVKFGSTQAGALATARFMQHGYQGVITALRNSDPVGLYQAVNASGWCKGCQGGIYPTGLHSMISGGKVEGGSANFQGSFGSKGLLAGGGAGGSGSGGSGGGSGSQDTGGLFGFCKTTSTQVIPFGPSIPTGGFGCYVLQTLKFGALGGGGALLMLVGLGLVVSPGLLTGIGLGAVGKLGSLGDLGGALGAAGSKSESVALKPQASAEKAAPGLNEELRQERMKQEKAKTRQHRAKARDLEHKARQTKANTGTSYSLSPATEAALSRAQSAPRRGRPDRIAG